MVYPLVVKGRNLAATVDHADLPKRIFGFRC